MDKKYHVTGKLVVASGYVLENMVDQMARIAKEVKAGLVVVVTPVPRYMDPCCEDHGQGKDEVRLEEDREKLLRSVWAMKRETYQLMSRSHCKNFVVVSPMEVLGLKDSVDKVRRVMKDGVHLDVDAREVLADHIIQRAE